MSNQLVNVEQGIKLAFKPFSLVANGNQEAVAKYFSKEANFLKSAFMKDQKLMTCTPESICDTLTSIAQFGLSLNPSKSEAYLIPYGNQLTLAISYIGLIKIAQQEGVLKHAEAVLVYDDEEINVLEKDGITTVEHKRNPFKRGELIGVYSKAILTNGVATYEFMSMEDLDAIHNSSKAKNSTAWTTWKTEMYKKAVIKRHSKSWNSQTLSDAVQQLNEHEGNDFKPKKNNIIQLQKNNDTVDYSEFM